jgi:hypothetical protein
MAGTCINSTGETILVYGPNSAATPQDKDNALYRLPPGRKTAPGWDCDGIYIPNDRIGDQVLGADIPGPAAVKYVSVLNFEITRQGNKYVLPGNQGVFKPAEVCCPSNYPKCVCWDIPNKSQSQTASYPEATGHAPA